MPGRCASALHSARNTLRRCSWSCKASQGLMDGAAQAELARRVRIQIAEVALPPRRSRTCQRKVCRLMDKWPRMMPPSASSLPQIFCRHDDCLHQAQLKIGLHARRVQHGGTSSLCRGRSFGPGSSRAFKKVCHSWNVKSCGRGSMDRRHFSLPPPRDRFSTVGGIGGIRIRRFTKSPRNPPRLPAPQKTAVQQRCTAVLIQSALSAQLTWQACHRPELHSSGSCRCWCCHCSRGAHSGP